MGNSRKIRNIFMINIIAVFMGQFYIGPSSTGFRLTLAVLFMSLFLLYFRDYSIMAITLSIGVSTFLFRSVIYFLGHDAPCRAVLMLYLPVISYYLFFGVLFKVLAIRKIAGNPVSLFLNLWICDAIPNIIEASLRKSWQSVSFNELIITIVLVGLVRTFIIVVVYNVGNRYISRLQRNEREKYYREIIIFISKLKTELFLLKKSRQDIEDAVSYVHNHYDSIEDEEVKGPLLKVAKDLHEIKKDYLRVIAGMNSIFTMDSKERYMSIKDILSIVKDNLEKLSAERNKKIVVSTNYDKIFLTSEYYTLISMLNNLTVNSLDAISSFGAIDIKCRMDEGCITMEVRDTGEGIKQEKLELIFDTGYTTKYNKETGEMSTGLGLSHIKSLMDEYYGGTVEVESEKGKGTCFILKFPKDKIMKEGG
ncbi:two-component system, sensor histidine kinase YcbA [Dethiosulfatibacter aminovorans DSM 17477]|uniref:histidine kinase n=1 Tax=Dethiosulfatibacter aminovorans DSM 17477 TaxID=1121476 RepID=A0A1M6EM08_9FIRM|nr:ATP-binding protein [Dethiosulfatibacter aminovorans]SHI86542.1 two-component system, sensor histidine kinase YcbA [Dethiosulfatibacter aminovorans DSM 17477]